MSHLSRRTLLGGAAAAAATPTILNAQDEAQSSEPGKTPHTKFAANIEMWWTDLPFLDRIRAAADLGFPGVEFWPYRGKDIDAIGKLGSELGIEIVQFTAWGFVPGLNDPANHDAFVQRIQESCEVAKRMNCKKATVVGGNDQPGMSPEEMHRNITEGLKRVAETAEKEDLMLILEPMNIRVDHKGHCLYGSPEAVAICREVGSSHVKINWDLYHMQITEGDLCGRMKEGFDQIGYLQLADHPGRMEPGTGEVHYNRVLKEAYDLGYRDFVGLECRPQGGDEERAARRVHAADTW